MKNIHFLAVILLIIGGLNWLLAAFGWDIANWVPSMPSWWVWLMKIVYVLVGISALIEIFTHKSNCKLCGGNSMPVA